MSSGELEAANESEIVDRLRDQGLMPMQIAQALGAAQAPGVRGKAVAGARWFQPRRVTRDHVLSITRELATLLRAGLPLDRALELLISLAPTLPVAVMLQGIRDEVRGGKALSQALDARRDIFSRFYVNIVRAGEAGGALGTVLQRLAETMDRNKELRESVRSALIYPTILVGVAVMSVMILLVFVVPQFQSTFAQAGKALPIPTQIVIVAGTFLQKWWWAMIPAIALFVLWFRRRGRNPAVRRVRDSRLLRMPLLGDLIGKIEVARFARTLSTLIGNGVTLLAGLAIVKDTMGNVVLSGALEGVIAKLREGQGFRAPARGNGPLSAARDADDPRRRGKRAPRGDAVARRRRLRPRGRRGDQALPRGAGAGADPRARGPRRRHRVLGPARRHGHERTRDLISV